MKNKVLIIADTFRAQNVSCYGYKRDTTPFLDEIAEKGTIFENAYSASTWSVSSHASIFSGKMPSEHGCLAADIQFKENSFVEALAEEGYNTYSVCFNPFVSPQNGFDKGFEYFESNLSEKIIYEHEDDLKAWKNFFNTNKSGKTGRYIEFLLNCIKYRDTKSLLLAIKYFTNGKSLGLHVKEGDRITAKIVEEKIETGEFEEPFFLFVNLMGAHNPYQTASENEVSKWANPTDITCQRRGFQPKDDPCKEVELARYDSALRFVDSKIKTIVKSIEKSCGPTSYVITSDHGENLGENEVLNNNALWGHQYGITLENVKVPLIIADPEISRDKIEDNFSITNLPKFFTENKIHTNDSTVYSEYHGMSDAFKLDIKSAFFNMLKVTSSSKIYEVLASIIHPKILKKFYSNKSLFVKKEGDYFIYHTEFKNEGSKKLLKNLREKYPDLI